jgi:hypothetical protein
MKTLILAITLLSTVSAQAADFGHWAGQVKNAMEGNYECYPTQCVDSDPLLPSVNCQNLNDITFAFSRFKEGATTGYLWLTYAPDGPTADDAALSRDFTIDGNFNLGGFTSTGVFKDPTMGSSHTVAVKSMRIEMHPPVGATARAVIDFGGRSPTRIDLKCCTPGSECNPGMDQDPSQPPVFQNPPELCPAFPKADHDACMGRT